METKKKISLMLVFILLMQIILPMLTIMLENVLTQKSIAYGGTKYYINSAQDMWEFAELVNNGDTFEGVTVYLTKDIDLGCTEEKQWVPIGNYDIYINGSYQRLGFYGIFNGQSHSISGIYIDADSKFQGLFGYNKGTIQNLILKQGQVKSTGSCTGAITGMNSGVILEVINEVGLTGGNNLGGICGRNFGEITSCENKGAITGLESITGKQIGGLAGYNSGTITSCKNSSIINGNEREGSLCGVGGIVGYNSGVIEKCNNNGSINNESNSGGIAGYNESKILDSKNNGNITGKYTLGGIVGRNDYRSSMEGEAIISNCINTGIIKSTLTNGGTSYVGGIAGKSACATNAGRVIITDCYNLGNIEGSVYLGGICGFQGDGNGGDTSYIKKCYNLGTVESKVFGTETTAVGYSQAGGILGCNNCGYIEECYNKGTVKGIAAIGGIAGLNSGFILNNYNAGEIIGNIDYENSTAYQLSHLSKSNAAGLVGSNYDIIKNCYNTGKVTADYASGLVSGNNVQGRHNGNIENCYTVGEIQANQKKYIVKSNNGTIKNSYYLDEIYTETTEENVTCLSSSYMKTQEFVNILNSDEINYALDSNNINTGYPILKFQTEEHIHLFDNGVVTKPATCEEVGIKIFTCILCGETKEEEIVALGHTEVIDKAMEATCKTVGKTEGKHCSKCGEIIVAQKEIPALEHNYENGVCTRCGEKELKIEIVSSKYEIQEYISKISPKTTVEEIKNNIETNATMKIVNKNDEEIQKTEIVSTGMKLKLTLGVEKIEYEMSVIGDITGAGKANFFDMLEINSYRLGKKDMSSLKIKSADVDNNDKVDFLDMIKINKYRLGKIEAF